MNVLRRPAPTWFSVVAIVLLLWGMMGCWACFQQLRFGAEAMGPATDYDRALHARLPVWYNALYAVAVGTGFLAALALLVRSVLALPLAAISVVGVVGMFGWMFAMTDIVAVKGIVTAGGFPLFILVVALAQFGLARLARGRGWIG